MFSTFWFGKPEKVSKIAKKQLMGSLTEYSAARLTELVGWLRLR
jgi:hypothetical protein